MSDTSDSTPPSKAPVEQSNSSQQEKQSEPSPELSKTRRVPWGWISVILVLGVFLGCAYWLYRWGTVELQKFDAQLVELRALQAEQRQNLERSIASAESQSQQQRKALQQSMDKAIGNTNTQIQDLQARSQAQAKRLLAMSDTSRDDWLLAEAEYLLKLANQRIRIERTAEGAEALLEEADNILRDLDDPDLLPLRRAIAEDLADLRLIEKIDVNGTYLRLVALTNQVPKLPIRPSAEVRKDGLAQLELDEAPAEGVRATVARSWRKFIRSLNQYIGYRKVDTLPEAILAEADEEYLKQNLMLTLQRAQLALLREDQKIYRVSLEQAEQWCKTHYYPSAVIEQYRQSLLALSQKNIAQELPDISYSLRMLSEYIAALHELEGVKPKREARQ